MLRRIAAVFLIGSVAMAAPAFAVKKGRVKYRGGTIKMEEGKEAPYDLNADAFVVTPKQKHGSRFEIPYAAMTKITYGQPSGVQWVTFAKSKKHFVTLSWEGGARVEGGAGVFEFDKADINKVLAVLSAKSGVEIQYLEEASK